MIRFENVGLRYGLGPEVLRDLSFRIEPQSFQFLTGPSGAGKTSLLRLLFLSLQADARPDHRVRPAMSATLDQGRLPTLRRRIGVVFQDFRLLDHLTTYENVALPLRVLGPATRPSYRAEVVELLHWVGLGDRMHALPPVLSGGEKQRAAIARAVIARPRDPARRRADRQRRSAARAAPAAAVRRAQQARHLGGDRHPRHQPDEPVRRAPPGAARRPADMSMTDPIAPMIEPGTPSIAGQARSIACRAGSARSCRRARSPAAR